MDIYNKIQNFLDLHIPPHLYKLRINDYSINVIEGESVLLKDKFVVGILLTANSDELKSFNKLIPNVYYKKSFGVNVHYYRTGGTKEELEHLLQRILPYTIAEFRITYFNVSREAFMKANQYVTDHFRLPRDNRKYSLVHAPLGQVEYEGITDIIDDTGFYIGIEHGSSSVESYDTIKEMLGSYCEEFLSVDINSKATYNVLLAKNIDQNFMSKFNLVKERLDTKVFLLVLCPEYLKQFED